MRWCGAHDRRAWSACFAAAYAIAALVYTFDAGLQPQAGRPNVPATLLATAAMLLMTFGMTDHVGLTRRAARRWQAAAVALVVPVVAALLTGTLSRMGIFGVYASFLLFQAAMAWQAMRRERGAGHGLVLLACCCTGPRARDAGGWLEFPLLRYALILPLTVSGMTVLMTGQLRARRQALEELQRRREAEDALRALNESLEQKVEQRTAELRDMVSGLESFNRSVSHDLRGPLGGIAGVARLAGEALQRGDASTAQQLLPAIAAQAESSAQLVAALLSLARAGHADLEPRPVDLDQLVREAVADLGWANPGAAVPKVMVQTPLPTVQGDPSCCARST
jgi:signal transduction histidine kinase